jgi:hypothetical protein
VIPSSLISASERPGPPLNRHPLYGDLLVPGGHPQLLAVGSHLLVNLNLTSFALTCTCPKLFFGLCILGFYLRRSSLTPCFSNTVLEHLLRFLGGSIWFS